MTLSDGRLKTGLMIMAKRWDTGSPWVIHNNPRGKYVDSPENKNKNYKLAQVVRACTAAPSFFRPEYITVAENVEGAFVDGGVTPHNNPAETAQKEAGRSPLYALLVWNRQKGDSPGGTADVGAKVKSIATEVKVIDPAELDPP